MISVSFFWTCRVLHFSWLSDTTQHFFPLLRYWSTWQSLWLMMFLNKPRSQKGVPQGSIIRPLTFKICINELPNQLIYCTAQMYANDPTISLSSESPECLQTNINTDLEILNNWFLDNYLKLNKQKSKLIIIGTKNRLKTSKLSM